MCKAGYHSLLIKEVAVEAGEVREILPEAQQVQGEHLEVQTQWVKQETAAESRANRRLVLEEEKQ